MLDDVPHLSRDDDVGSPEPSSPPRPGSPDGIDVHLARPHELDAAGQAVAEAYLADLRVNEWYAARLRDAASRAARATLLVAVDVRDGAVLGSLTYARGGTPYAQLADSDECEIRMLGVRPEARGRGVGERLVRAAMAQGTTDGAVRMVLSTQTEMQAAHRLYERLGFTRRPDLDWVPEQDTSVQLIGYDRPLT
ncbi:MAG TPA: GNAT family N-acetyltransferase [Actinomycetales bacterium]|nr:GNAT family N-acetyltransferase [Actinomycetales bacterium]